jgi:hypothetical protein
MEDGGLCDNAFDLRALKVQVPLLSKEAGFRELIKADSEQMLMLCFSNSF